MIGFQNWFPFMRIRIKFIFQHGKKYRQNCRPCSTCRVLYKVQGNKELVYSGNGRICCEPRSIQRLTLFQYQTLQNVILTPFSIQGVEVIQKKKKKEKKVMTTLNIGSKAINAFQRLHRH